MARRVRSLLPRPGRIVVGMATGLHERRLLRTLRLEPAFYSRLRQHGDQRGRQSIRGRPR
jgi:hypothetical protein